VFEGQKDYFDFVLQYIGITGNKINKLDSSLLRNATRLPSNSSFSTSYRNTRDVFYTCTLALAPLRCSNVPNGVFILTNVIIDILMTPMRHITLHESIKFYKKINFDTSQEVLHSLLLPSAFTSHLLLFVS